MTSPAQSSLSRHSSSLEKAYFDMGEALAIASKCCRVCTDQLSTKSSTTDWSSQSKSSLHITKSRPDDKHLRPANMNIRDKYFMHVRGGFSQDPPHASHAEVMQSEGGRGESTTPQTPSSLLRRTGLLRQPGSLLLAPGEVFGRCTPS